MGFDVCQDRLNNPSPLLVYVFLPAWHYLLDIYLSYFGVGGWDLAGLVLGVVVGGCQLGE